MVETAQTAEQTTEGAQAVAEAQAVIAETEAKKPTEPAKAEPEVDWKAKAQELESNIAKLTKQVEDGRSREIAVLTQAKRDDLLRVIAERQEVLATAVESQDWAKYRQTIGEIDARERQTQLTAEVEEVRASALEELADVDKELGGGLDKHPLFDAVRLYWNQGVKTGNPYYFERAVAEAHKAARKLEKETTGKTHAKALKDAKEEARKAALVEAGAFDNGAGAEAGGGAASIQSLVNKYGKGEALSFDETKKVHEAMSKGIYPKGS